MSNIVNSDRVGMKRADWLPFSREPPISTAKNKDTFITQLHMHITYTNVIKLQLICSEFNSFVAYGKTITVVIMFHTDSLA